MTRDIVDQDTERADKPANATPSSARESTTDLSHEDYLKDLEATDKQYVTAFADEDITKMTDEALMVKAECLLKCLHDYEMLCLFGSNRSERARGRAAKDSLVEVCFEIGLRQLANQFQRLVFEHRSGYEASLAYLKTGDIIREDEKATGRLSWWNL